MQLHTRILYMTCHESGQSLLLILVSLLTENIFLFRPRKIPEFRFRLTAARFRLKLEFLLR